MRRLFISLYIALGIAFLICVLGVPWLFSASLRSPAEHFGESLAAAPQFLFEQELNPLPQSQWPTYIHELQSHFGYNLSLKKLNELDVNKQQLELLRTGQAITPTTSNGSTDITLDAMLLPIRNSEYVVETHFAESDEEKVQRSMGGIFYLIEKHFNAIPPTLLSAELQRFNTQYGIPLQQLTDAQARLTPLQLQTLDAYKVVGIDINSTSDETYFKRLSDGTILKIGPLPVPNSIRFATPIAYGTFAAVLAIITFLWIRPMWRDMRRLDRRATEFGSGNLAARVEVTGGSSIKILADAFNAMADQIQALITNQREMSHAISHELRTPLARLRFTIDLLSRSTTDTDRSRFIAGMEIDIRELEELVDESLSYARLTSPTVQTAHTESVVIGDWIENVLDANRHLANSISVTTELVMTQPTAELDHRLLGRALQNLIRNALQYAKSHVHVIVTNRNGQLEFMIDDDGPGIPDDQRESIFMPFHRIDSSRSRETGGYGLGLAIVKRICDLHHAKVAAEDSPLGGARFHISLLPKATS